MGAGMRIRVKGTAAGPWGVILAGRTGIVPDATGLAMIAAKQAEEVSDEPDEESKSHDVMVNAETATAEPEQETTAAPVLRRRRRHAEVS